MIRNFESPTVSGGYHSIGTGLPSKKSTLQYQSAISSVELVEVDETRALEQAVQPTHRVLTGHENLILVVLVGVGKNVGSLYHFLAVFRTM